MLGHHSVSTAPVSALVAAVQFADDLEYTMPDQLMHWGAGDGRCAYTMRIGRVHYRG